VGVNLKYEYYYLVVRGGIAWGQIGADDKNNGKIPDIRNRNLSFKSNILELSLCAELNLMEPDIFYAYPYVFGGIGLMRFNPYTNDNAGQKTFLHPLGTEGQGLSEYPDRKSYSLTQICIPFGAGWKVDVNDNWGLGIEFGYRILFTDYLDDVSKTYVNTQVLLNKRGPKSAELAFRATPVPGTGFFPTEGDMRGNSGVKDGYFFNGLKVLYHFRKNKHKQQLLPVQ
jgi:opacity protein-like surface antigen